LPKEASLHNWFARDGATFSIMVSALNIALTRRIFICQVQMDMTTTDAEKQKLLAFRESGPVFKASTLMVLPFACIAVPDPTVIMTHLNKSDDYIQQYVSTHHS
jgi:hypothetical protein